MNRPRLLLVLAVVLATAVGLLSGARRAFADVATFVDVGPVAAPLTAIHRGSVAWGDYNSDGKLDILLTGTTATDLVSKIYRNNGDGTFTEDTTAESGLTGVYYSSVAWGDYNSDGKPDILLTGEAVSGPVSKIYRNNGNGTFTEDTVAESGLAGVQNSSVAWGDYNSDGKPDILLTGWTGSANVSKIYRNNGNGTFTEDTVAESGLTGVVVGSVAWGDYNSDGKPDILLTGRDALLNRVAKIYRNNGNGTFAEDTTADSGLAGVQSSSVAWGDYNSDGRPDILLTGLGAFGVLVSKIYRNDSGTTFTEDTTADSGLTGVFLGSGGWGDYNSDGKPDILLTGSIGASDVSKIYRNNSGTAFTEDTAADGLLAPVSDSSVAWGDYNSDGKPDILLVGANGASLFGNVYRNLAATANTAPTVPSGLSASFSPGLESLSWNAAGDSQTAAAALSYNLRVGTTPGGSQVVSPLSLPNGTRLVPRDGNAGERTSYKIAGLPAGTYYWSVQAVDSGFAGSPFASEKALVVPESFAFSSATYSVGEAGPAITVTINRAGLTSGSASVHFATANGTASAGSDYTAVSQAVSFAAGATQRTVSIPITNDTLHEANETVRLALSSPSAGATLGSPSAATLTIVDNDVAPPPPANGRIKSAKLSKKSFPRAQARKVKLTCKFSPKSKIFKYVLSFKKGKKWAVVKNVRKTGSFTKLTRTVKQLFAGKRVKRGSYRLKLSADKNSKTLRFTIT